jgi:hypothetical protein
MPMPLYWKTSAIPALKALADRPKKEQWAYIQPVIGRVLCRWQVWLPIVIFLLVAAVFIFVVPDFPYRLLVALVGIIAFGKIAFLPYNHYLNDAITAEAQRQAQK